MPEEAAIFQGVDAAACVDVVAFSSEVRAFAAPPYVWGLASVARQRSQQKGETLR